VEAARGSTVQITISTGPEQVRVPAVEGMSEGDAQDALDAEGLVAEVECVVVVDPGQVGIVQDTDPEANTLVEVGSTVIVKVGQAAC
jgi:serine/threonine-protein kinase